MYGVISMNTSYMLFHEVTHKIPLHFALDAYVRGQIRDKYCHCCPWYCSETYYFNVKTEPAYFLQTPVLTIQEDMEHEIPCMMSQVL